jgi:hypothetical protein
VLGVVDAADDVELEEVDWALDEVVGELEEVDVVLVLDVGWDIEEVVIELVVELLAWGEAPSVTYAPTAATAMTRTTIPARAAPLAAFRRLENLE